MIPNFVAVNFYNYGDLMRAVVKLNGLGSQPRSQCRRQRSWSLETRQGMRRMRLRKYTAQIHRTPSVNHAVGHLPNTHMLVAPGTPDGTMSFVWSIAECINAVRSRLPTGVADQPRDGDRKGRNLQQICRERLSVLIAVPSQPRQEKQGEVPARPHEAQQDAGERRTESLREPRQRVSPPSDLFPQRPTEDPGNQVAAMIAHQAWSPNVGHRPFATRYISATVNLTAAKKPPAKMYQRSFARHMSSRPSSSGLPGHPSCGP